MKKFWFALVALLMILSFFSSSNSAEEAVSVWTFIPDDRPLVVAHRGASSLAPENTLAAIKVALDLGVDVVEIDVHKTYDGELVVLHDETVNRTTTGTGKVKDLTLADIKKLDAGVRFGSSFKGERIPTLREVLEVMKDSGAVLLIELKGARTEVPTVELVREFEMSGQVIIQSFDFRQIQKTKKNAPEIPTVHLVNIPNHSSEPQKAATWMANTAEYAGATGIGIKHSSLTPELIAITSERNLALLVWTVDKTPDMQKFIRMGVQAIITNRPQDLLTLLP